MKNVFSWYTIGTIIITIGVVIGTITVFKNKDTVVVDDSMCWNAGTIYGNDWENGKHEVILCPKTKEDILAEYR